MQHSLYETVFIARQDLSTDDIEALIGKFSKIITDEKGKISYEYWGLRTLAFPIKKNSKGINPTELLNLNNKAYENILTQLPINSKNNCSLYFMSPSKDIQYCFK